jgi:hypothetical protein
MSEPDIQNEDTEAIEATDAAMPEKAPSRDADDEILDRLFADEDEPVDASDDDEPTTVPASPDRDRYAAVLKRDGVPEDVIASVSEDTLRAWADKASKRQKDVDGYGKKMADLEKQLKSGAKQEPQDSGNDGEDDVDIEPDAADADASKQEDPFAEIEELLGDDAAKPLKAMRAELAELRKQQQQSAEQSLLAQVDSADAYFRGQYGAKAPERDAVIAEMNRLGAANPGTYKTVMHLAEEAYASLAGKVVAKSDRKKVAGQPTAAKTVSRTERPRTPVDAEDAILDALLEGKSRDEAMRLIRK